MTPRKIYLMSSREPSGATWLINCLLELGIKTFRNRSHGSDMWFRRDDHHVLNGQEEILKKWLPALWDHQEFKFRDDIEVEWAHVWPTADHDDYQVIYFARDPRDSLFSRYKREAPDQTFEEFLMFPDANTLLDKAHNWNLFNLAWMQHPRQRVFLFEDYKQDAWQVLTEVLDYIGLTYSEADMQRALIASTFERAAQAEAKYRAKHPEDQETINRAGKAGEWRQGGISPEIVSYIENVCADAMRFQGYDCNVMTQQESNYSSLVTTLPFFQQLKLPEMAFQSLGGTDLSGQALVFAESLQSKSLQRARLRQYEIGWLLNNLTILLRTRKPQSAAKLRPLYRAFGLELGFWQKLRCRIRALPRRTLKLLGHLSGRGK